MGDTGYSDILKKKEVSKLFDPCQEESNNSMKCLDENNYDKGKCKDLFILYRECKKKWVSFFFILFSFKNVIYIIFTSFFLFTSWKSAENCEDKDY